MPEPKEEGQHDESLFNSERDDVYAKYEQMNQEGGEFLPVKLEQEETPEEEIQEEETETSPEEEVTEQQDSELEEEGKIDEEEQQKTVPLEALHEERNKRKAAQNELRELNEKVKVVLEDNKKLMELIQQQNEEPPQIDDYDKEIISLKRELGELKKENAEYKKERIRETQSRLKKEFDNAIDNLDKKLEAEGVVGFKFLLPTVLEEIKTLQKTDSERFREIMQTDDDSFLKGVEQIYKETVYPKFSEKFNRQTKKEKDVKKEDLKKKAGLTASPGKVEQEPKADGGDWTLDEYMKMRKSSNLFG